VAKECRDQWERQDNRLVWQLSTTTNHHGYLQEINTEIQIFIGSKIQELYSAIYSSSDIICGSHHISVELHLKHILFIIETQNV